MYAERPPSPGLAGRLACEWLRTSDTLDAAASGAPASGPVACGVSSSDLVVSDVSDVSDASDAFAHDALALGTSASSGVSSPARAAEGVGSAVLALAGGDAWREVGAAGGDARRGVSAAAVGDARQAVAAVAGRSVRQASPSREGERVGRAQSGARAAGETGEQSRAQDATRAADRFGAQGPAGAGEGTEAETVLVVPDACVDLIWGDDGPFVAGPDTGPIPATIGTGEILIGVRFRPGAVGAFFGVPLADLLDSRVPLADLPGGHAFIRELTDGPIDTAQARLQALRAAVQRRLLDPDCGHAGQDLDPAAPAIAEGLRQGKAVSEVAWSLGFSERQLRRRSVAAFGYSPKTLQRIVRFQHALRLARAGLPLAQVAATAGYTDQAHMANDVRRLSGGPMRGLL